MNAIKFSWLGLRAFEGFYNFSDICVPVDLFTPSLYKFDVTGKDIEDNHTMEHEHKFFLLNIF